ncbi:NmrA family NAD(P)-binding protein [Gordonia sp. zg691]|uniref:NmrA family NAD(P)-binding protein n=1 Tax=Gordonia jinghuaiqii TaxID=2758710 RepID=UPI00166231FB|nr:NmrA family NAD(P)-binding protein [Gordonia jinghuaiqii]MBD0862815.1 NmrA family NAD(P)-binding protein [Gordonia jinghuaiqii]
MTTTSAPVLVTGATGRQGGSAARALLAAGIPVRALVRDPESPRAQAIEALGAALFVGNLDDLDSLTDAAEGARAVFSVQMPDFTGRAFDGELAQGKNLIAAAMRAEVPSSSIRPSRVLRTTPRGLPPAGIGHDWMNYAIQPARPEYATALGVSVTRFADWAREHLSTSADH